MSLSLCFTQFTSHPKQAPSRIPLYKPINPIIISTTLKLSNRRFPIFRCVSENSEHVGVTPEKPRWENWLATAASLYPIYVTVGGVVACFRPSTFSWFVKRAPTSYSLTLGFIMLVMGITLELRDLINLFVQRPLEVSLLSDHF
ncbi:Na+-bile acid cotransporter [Abeliophyllum distichum]|uniref:Na+-bile acid cotransporter n=1 Tax=Abeliophyllum distichum TaxID=126358 RepID=A0ABD1PAZ8_9LAMI